MTNAQIAFLVMCAIAVAAFAWTRRRKRQMDADLPEPYDPRQERTPPRSRNPEP